MIWICAIVVLVGSGVAALPGQIGFWVAGFFFFLLLAWLFHAGTGLIAIVVTYVFNMTLGYPLSPRSFNIIVYSLAYSMMAILVVESYEASHPYIWTFLGCGVFGLLGWINARRFSEPFDRQRVSFSTRQMFILTAWISVSFSVVLVDHNFALLVAIPVLAMCVVLLAGRIFGR